MREVEELAAEGLERRGGREEVCVEEVEGLVGEEGCLSKKKKNTMVVSREIIFSPTATNKQKIAPSPSSSF